MERREKILAHINPAGFGLEVGPAFAPILPKADGYRVEIIDHLDAQGLRDKYANTPGVNLTSIEDVDYVWDGRPLDELIGHIERYDFIIASHVIEHTPDLVNYLRACERLLRPAGILSLVVPDERFCFDYFRFPTTTGEVLDAYLLKRTRHSPGAVFDHVALVTERNGKIAWDKTSIGEVTLKHNIADAIYQYERAKSSREYIDIHNWRFTPSSFRLILRELRKLDLTSLVEKCFFETSGCEFYVSLEKPPAPLDETSAMLSDAERLSLIRDVREELMSCGEGVESKITRDAEAPTFCHDTETALHNKRELADLRICELDRLNQIANETIVRHTQQYHDLSRMLSGRNAELQSAKRRLDTIMASRSWRLTAPLRMLNERLHRTILSWIAFRKGKSREEPR